MQRDMTWLFKAQLLRAQRDPSLEDLCGVIPNGRVNLTQLAAILGVSYVTASKLVHDPRFKVQSYRLTPKGPLQIPVEEVHRLLQVRGGIIK